MKRAEKGARTETVNLRCITLAASKWLSGDTLPKELKLFKFGENPTIDGVVRLSAQSKQLLPLLQDKFGFDKIALDFMHNTVPGSTAYKESQEPRSVAAYGTPEFREDGLYLAGLDWTPDGMKSARNFLDLSPVPKLNDNNEVLFLHSVALCRQGKTKGLTMDGLQTLSVELPLAMGDEANTNQDEETLMEKILGILREGLKLDKNASEADIQTALIALAADCAAMKTQLTTLSADLVASKAEVAKLTTLSAKDVTLTTLSAKIEATDGKLSTFQAELDKRDRDALLALAVSEGKVVPLTAEQIGKTDVATLREMVSKLAVTVPLSAKTPGDVKTFSATGAGMLSEQDLRIGTQLGYTAEQIKAANGMK